jgi:hypothetical protein
MYASVLGAFVLLRFVLLRVLLTNNRSCMSMCSSRVAFAHRSEDDTSKLPRPRGYKPTAFRPAGWQGYGSASTDDDADDEFNSLLNAAGAPAAAAAPAATAPAATAPAATAPAATAPAAAAPAAAAPAAAPDAAAPAASAEGEGDWLEEMVGEFAEAKE